MTQQKKTCPTAYLPAFVRVPDSLLLLRSAAPHMLRPFSYSPHDIMVTFIV